MHVMYIRSNEDIVGICAARSIKDDEEEEEGRPLKLEDELTKCSADLRKVIK